MKYSILLPVFCAGFLAHALWVAIIKGRVMAFIWACWMILGVLADVACQLWLDVSKLWRFNKRLRDLNKDEYDFHD